MVRGKANGYQPVVRNTVLAREMYCRGTVGEKIVILYVHIILMQIHEKTITIGLSVGDVCDRKNILTILRNVF